MEVKTRPRRLIIKKQNIDEVYSPYEAVDRHDINQPKNTVGLRK